MLDDMDYAIRILVGIIAVIIIGVIVAFVIVSKDQNEFGNAEESMEYVDRKKNETPDQYGSYATYTPAYKYEYNRKYNSKDDGQMSIKELTEAYQRDANISVSVNQDTDSNLTIVTVNMDYDNTEVERFTNSTVIKSKSDQTYSLVTKDSSNPKEVTFYMEGILDPSDILVGVGSITNRSYCYYNQYNQYVDYDYPEDKLMEQRITAYEDAHSNTDNTPVREDYLTGENN